MPANAHTIIVFDGVCKLCNAWVDFILRNDGAGQFRLATMQGVAGRRLAQIHGVSADDPNSVLLVEGDTGYTDSEAVIRVLEGLGHGWRWAARAMRLVPRALRDPVYRWIAGHRYRLFGKRRQCRMPDPTQAWRFLE